MKNIVIVGTGFAALTAVRTLRKYDNKIGITVISPKPEFHYLPGSIWIPCGLRKPTDLIIQLSSFFQRMNVKYISAKALGIEKNGRSLITDVGTFENDAIIICSGGQFLKKIPGIENVITPCEGIDAAVQLKERLKTMEQGTISFGFSGNPKEPSAMRGGPMFEFLFGIDTQLRNEGRREKFKLVFFTPSKTPGQRLGPKAVNGLIKEMKKRDIETHLGQKIKKFNKNSIVLENSEINSELIVFMPGMTGNSWFNNSCLPLSEGGMIKANKYCQVEGLDMVYVAGDSGNYPGPDWMPKQAHMADLQAEAAAKNVLLEFNNKPVTNSFVVELLCIIDSQKKGIFVSRTTTLNVIFPSLTIFHWLKRFFEWRYLRQYK